MSRKVAYVYGIQHFISKARRFRRQETFVNRKLKKIHSDCRKAKLFAG